MQFIFLFPFRFFDSFARFLWTLRYKNCMAMEVKFTNEILLIFALNYKSMKTFLTLSLQLLITSYLWAQSPLGIPYQAVMRNSDGSVMANNAVELTFMIHDVTATGTVVYQESHSLTSNSQGLVSCVVGNGVVSQGNFANINWGSGAKFLHVMMGSTDLGTQQMLSVPFALHSKSADVISNGIIINSTSNDGDTLYLSNGQTFVSSSGQGTGSSDFLVLPIITTNAVTGITSNSATFSGSISNANGYEIMERGVVYATSPHPTINANKIQIGSGIGVFDSTSALSYQYAHLLSPNTTYYVRAYALTENNIIAYGNEISFTTLVVGNIGLGGGLVFFNKGNMDGGWQHLEVAPIDQSSNSPWGCNGTSIPGTSFLVGSGESNTNLILANCPDAPAASLCSNLSLGGQTDWFLPSRDELNLIYTNLNTNQFVAGNMGFGPSNYYLSSTEDSSNSAWLFSFDDGISTAEYYLFSLQYTSKQLPFLVRAVRAF
jgi:hypothetical protein